MNKLQINQAVQKRDRPLDQAIVEANLVRLIVAARDQIRKLESTEGYAEEIRLQTDGIIFLEDTLDTVRKMASNWKH